MNKRIYTLAEQVGAIRWNDELNGNSIDFSPTQFEKFAELIVRECDRYVTERYDKDGFTEPWMSPGDLLKHFGVEE